MLSDNYLLFKVFLISGEISRLTAEVGKAEPNSSFEEVIQGQQDLRKKKLYN